SGGVVSSWTSIASGEVVGVVPAEEVEEEAPSGAPTGTGGAIGVLGGFTGSEGERGFAPTGSEPIGGDTGKPLGGDTGRPLGGDTGRPPGGDTGRPPGGDTGRPLGGETGRPLGGDTGRPLGAANSAGPGGLFRGTSEGAENSAKVETGDQVEVALDESGDEEQSAEAMFPPQLSSRLRTGTFAVIFPAAPVGSGGTGRDEAMPVMLEGPALMIACATAC
ncbi:uncharacterized protein B0H18DRAFT_996352, partial [Fomitopsis serialis]|uniref:uncharacterized protein n=1 Tax=Fomitopsis serialis TaxID=139415 RepID=UPI002008B39E